MLRALAAHPLAFWVASCLGLALQVATLLVVRASGPVTLKLLALVRNAAVVLAEVLRGSAAGSPAQLAGYSISLLAFAKYTQLRSSRARGRPATEGPRPRPHDRSGAAGTSGRSVDKWSQSARAQGARACV